MCCGYFRDGSERVVTIMTEHVVSIDSMVSEAVSQFDFNSSGLLHEFMRNMHNFNELLLFRFVYG